MMTQQETTAQPTATTRRRAALWENAALGEGLQAMTRCVEELVVAECYDPLQRIILEHLETGGKQLRGRLALASAAALGLKPVEAAPLAAACELLHNATLIHDDLQDGDEVRRGRPAVWARYGVAQAINAGDLLLMLPTLALERLSCPDRTKWHLAASLARRSARTASGQSLEQCLLEHQLLTWDAYQLSARGKTGAFFGLPVEGAALLAGFSPSEAAALADAMLPLGVLFQIQDDVLDLYGDKGRGVAGNDLREGKVSALVVAHLALHPDEVEDLLGVLRAPRHATTEEDVERLSRRFIEGGALDAIVHHARELHRQVIEAPCLRAAPGLHALAVELAETIFRPLERACAKVTP
jgi:geranylgeranyl diphosphate synthase type I